MRFYYYERKYNTKCYLMFKIYDLFLWLFSYCYTARGDSAHYKILLFNDQRYIFFCILSYLAI